MSCLVLLPSLLCGAAVCVSDVRSRRVPRAWIAAGWLAQLLALVVWAVVANQLFTVMIAVVISVGAALLQLLLGLIVPGSLGFGDVTATFMVGLAVGAVGWLAVLYWWLGMGALGLATIAVGRRMGIRDVPFAPAIVVAGIVAVALAYV
ncbi:peptidase A24 [Bifidobacterium avesanii]|uniref:Peptidase A24 n=1 Tax=Bifidobacterium avesanii TaxID=1798157 RepID=A0A7K3TGR3_9BIFI|nr:peptidase A24 [Bifidobacterium avesanii]KAB8293576.1 peptidase A24 [Bifidobacterium avesanii]NEG78287.1 peptidase A24 [Bifidobacterium avesanii]